jgi:hypothetical protein
MNETLYITDAEIIRRMGVPEKIGYANLRALDADRRSGFPKKSQFWGDRRYWPAVKAYLDRQAGHNVAPPQTRERSYASGR